MGFFDIVKKAFPIQVKFGNIEKGSRANEAEVSNFPGAYSGGKEQPRGRGNFKDYLDTYELCCWIFVCVSRISTSLSQVPLKVWELNGEKKEDWLEIVDPEDPMLKLVTKPNPHMTQIEFLESISAAMELVGNSYLETVYGVGEEDPPIALYPLLPHRIKIVPDPKDFISGYLYDLPKGRVFFDTDEVIHFKFNNPGNQYYGAPPMRPAENSVIVDMYTTAYNKNFFRNSAVPDGVLATDQELSDGAIKRTKRQWNKMHQGVRNAHLTAVLEMGLKYEVTQMSAKDMQFVQQKKVTREEILSIYGVPPILAGIMEFASYSNAIEQWKQFWAETITPKLKRIEARLNHDLVPKFKNLKNRYIEFDTDSVMAMREDKEAEARTECAYIDRGILLINEIRRKKGLKEVSWGDTWWPNAGLTPVNLMGFQDPGRLNPGPESDFPSPKQPTAFPSQKLLIGAPATYAGANIEDIMKILKAVAEGDTELSPFRQAKLRRLLER
uniref:Putative portal protein n=1 Tax=viral metagenome TaxID=1070528 RepID=A0A6M3JU83_9ZZZZ